MFCFIFIFIIIIIIIVIDHHYYDGRSLVDESGMEGDLYIRCICFSPDHQFLVTGAEDKLIRVRITIHSFIVNMHFILISFSSHLILDMGPQNETSRRRPRRP